MENKTKGAGDDYPVIPQGEEAPKKRTKLKPGFYWVKSFDDQWLIAQYLHRGVWIQCGHDSYFSKDNFKEIDTNPIERK